MNYAPASSPAGTPGRPCSDSSVKERPILFSAPMVRTILDGRKTQTRRIIKTKLQLESRATITYRDPDSIVEHWPKQERMINNFGRCENVNCLYGVPGDRLWVRETWRPVGAYADMSIKEIGEYFDSPASAMRDQLRFHADDKPYDGGEADTWLPSIHMPRWASRITLEVTGVRIERLQDISEGDAWDEGTAEWAAAHPPKSPNGCTDKFNNVRLAYAALWDSINAKRAPWASNPWVWVVEFKRIRP